MSSVCALGSMVDVTYLLLRQQLWKNHNALWERGSTEHRVHPRSPKLHQGFLVPETYSKLNKKITKGNEGNMLQGHFIVGKGAKEVCINTPVPPFLCVFMAPYFKH